MPLLSDCGAVMTEQEKVEIQSTWDNYGDDAFEMLDTDGVTVEQVELVLGKDVAQAYSQWQYYNIK